MCLSSIAGAVEYKTYQLLPLVSQFVIIFSLGIKKKVEYTCYDPCVKIIIFGVLHFTCVSRAVVSRVSCGRAGEGVEGSNLPIEFSDSFEIKLFNISFL